MNSIKNNNKFKLVSMCIALYLYEIILGRIWYYNIYKVVRNKSNEQKLILLILMGALMGILFLLPIIIVTLSTNVKDIKISIKNNIKLNTVTYKILLTILFSIAVTSILHTLIGTDSLKFISTKFKILLFIEALIYALPEEILYRWFYQEKLEQIIPNKFIATLMTGLLFAIIHFFGTDNINSYENIIDIIFSISNRTTMHFFFNYIKEKSNSIIVPTIIHALYNYL
jgi:uncharacterized protein